MEHVRNGRVLPAGLVGTGVLESCVLVLERDRSIADGAASVFSCDVLWAATLAEGRRSLARMSSVRAALIALELATAPAGGGTSALAALIEISRGRFPEAPVVVLAAEIAGEQINQVHLLGAELVFRRGCLANLALVADRVRRAERTASDPTAAALERFVATHKLTAMQARVVRLAVAEMTNKEIAADLGISVAGVRYHVRQVLAKSAYLNLADIARTIRRAA